LKIYGEEATPLCGLPTEAAKRRRLVPLAGRREVNDVHILQDGLSRLRSVEAQRGFSGCVPPIIERDDGKWSIGFHDDAAGPFPSRQFAISVAIGVEPTPAPASVARFREVRRAPS
jgi:hypothetical protein